MHLSLWPFSDQTQFVTNQMSVLGALIQVLLALIAHDG
jgi:hypothetical protein